MKPAKQYAEWIVANADKKGSPQFEAVAKAYRLARQTESVDAAFAEPQADPMLDPTGTFGENLLAGAGKAFVDVGRGVKDIAGDAAGLVGARPEWARANDAEIARSRELDAPLMDTGGGLLGNVGANIAMAAPSLAIPGANTAVGSGLIGAVMGATAPTIGDESRAMNTLLAGGAGAAGQKAANVIGAKLSGTAGREAARRVQNQARDEIVGEAMDAGYVLPPVSVNPVSKAAQVAEAVSGKVMTQQMAAVRNQPVTNTLARRAVGLAEDAPLTEDALSAVRRAAGAVYDDIGKSVDTFKADAPFREAIDSAMADYRALIEEFPEMANKSLDGLAGTLSRDSFSGKNMLRLVRQIRKDAKANYKAFDDPQRLDLARAQSRSAKALEDLIERHLGNVSPGKMSAFRDARANIAKSHAIESALDESGNVDAHKIAKMLDKGEPLSGELRTIGRVAQRFRDATRRRTDSVNPITLLTGATAAFGAGSGNVPLMALALARPGVREAMLSKAGQSLLARPQYASGRVSGLIGGGLESDVTGLLAKSLPATLVGAP